VRYQPDVRQLWHAADENDVRRFDVAVDEADFVQMGESAGKGEADLHALGDGEPAALLEIGAKGARRIQFQMTNGE
jgi:hypothetical protein